MATKICHALEAEHHPLHLPVGADAELIAASRQGANFDDFVVAMREVLQIDW